MTQFKGCLKGSSDPVQAKRIIEFLTRLGGVNKFNCSGRKEESVYYIDEDGDIGSVGVAYQPPNYTLVELETNSLLPIGYWYRDSHGYSRGFIGKGGVQITESQFLALTGKEEKPFVWTTELLVECFESIYGSDKINAFKESKQRRPLFTTEDGQPLYEGDKLFVVTSNFGTIEDKDMPNERQAPPLKYFSTRSAAENYIVENKPVLSYKDVIGLLITSKEVEDLAPELKQLIQSKIKG